MAQLDLKNCDIFIEDGYKGTITGNMLVNQPNESSATGTMAVDNLSGYLAGVTTMLVDGVTGTVTPGERFTVPGGTVEHVITAQTPTLGNTTSITFTPALEISVADDAVLDFLTGYGAGVTTMLVDGSTGLVTNGDRFSVAGDGGVYHTISSSSATLGNTTSITFTPALGAGVLDNAAITFQPRQLHIRVGEGNMQWTEKRQIMYTKDRGKLDTVKKGDEEPVEVKLDFTWIFLRADSGEPPTVEDALKQRGEASTWISAAADLCEPYAVDIVVVYTPPCSGVKKEIYRLQDFRYEDLGHDLKQGQVSVSGKCNITEPTTVRSTSYPV